MTITVAEKITRAPAGEFAPMLPRAIREALRFNSDALALWAEAQSNPLGWSMGDREVMAADMGWSVYRVRRAINGLIRAGLYVVEKLRDAAGRWSTVCRILATLGASPQVEPQADSPKVGHAADIPPARDRKREGPPAGPVPHNPATCWREAAGLPCRWCAAYVAAAPRWPAKAPSSAPASRPVAEVLAPQPMPTRPAVERVECEHGRRAVACLACAGARFAAG